MSMGWKSEPGPTDFALLQARHRREVFMSALRHGATVADACKAAGVTNGAAQHWKHNHPELAAEWRAIIAARNAEPRPSMPLPPCFAANYERLGRDGCAKHYLVSTTTINTWREKAGLSPVGLSWRHDGCRRRTQSSRPNLTARSGSWLK